LWAIYLFQTIIDRIVGQNVDCVVRKRNGMNDISDGNSMEKHTVS
jgi:hypothetical protein